MKKKYLFAFILIISLLSLALTCCSDNPDDSGNTDKTQYIELTMDNYEYYLSIDKLVTGSGSALQGSFRYTTLKVTITGAISGLYQDCSLFYKIGDNEEKEVKLNAAGFATFDYTQSTNSGNFSFVRAKGKILI